MLLPLGRPAVAALVPLAIVALAPRARSGHRGRPTRRARPCRPPTARDARGPPSSRECGSSPLNVENLLGTRYSATSQGNNNIMPGATRTVRLSLAADF
jgi:hypothetical protein